MTLKAYRKKRNFSHTPEPQGKKRASRSRPPAFVVQQHKARRLHYDFRLEIDGALKSWAIPKGPSLNPEDKRLAVHVEDHPLEYGTFEGSIPAGQYGAGEVLLWDKGTWEAQGVVATQAYAKGRLRFTLNGKKLKGEWNLFRISGREAKDKNDNWLLVKGRDRYAKDASAKPIVELRRRSVKSGKRIEQLKRPREK